MAKGKRRKKPSRSPVPKPQKTLWTPDEVMQEFRYVQALVKTGYDKVREENEPLLAMTSSTTITHDQSQQLLAAANNGLLQAEMYEVNERMVERIHQISAVRRHDTPYLEQNMMPCTSGYVFFDRLWPDSFPRTQVRSLSWVLTTVESSDYGIVPAVHTIVYGAYDKAMGMFADVLPLGEEMRTEFYKHKGKSMRQLGTLLWSVWMMLGSELTATRRVRYDKRRVPKPLRNISHGEIRVVTLRHRRGEGTGEGREIDWQCSWWVHEHYRHLEKYEGPWHKAQPFGEDREHCFNCKKRITHIGGYTKDPAGLGGDRMKGTGPTIHKLVR